MESRDALIRQHFAALAPSYEDKSLSRAQYNNTIDTIAMAMFSELEADDVVLDIATGTGRRPAQLARQLSDVTLLGCDNNMAMMQQRADKRIPLAQADMRALPYKNEAFAGATILFGSFGYMPSTTDRIAALSEAARVMRPGAQLLLDVVNLWHEGEGVPGGFSKSHEEIEALILESEQTPDMERGDIHNSVTIDEENVPAFFHAFEVNEMHELMRQGGLEPLQHLVVGYETGQLHTDLTKGNLLFIAQKPV